MKRSDDLTVKRLTRDNPTMATKLAELQSRVTDGA
ncbi:hypothetical protein J2782_003216 [Brucella pseudogrignonensis]|uniref:Uncharacterized protein n=1 Tax=Brucella pseudogrignonensis TaxID=419475 RepID=A0ABU1MBQ6_9HYPH|nr:hypothetical protein [Brucella pseudogrignonensis]